MYIAGPSGKIECQLDQVADEGKGAIAVLCHPHPLYGGSMHDRVLSTVAHRFIESGITCLRFNFRGVGSSEGVHDNGEGEKDDLISVVDYVRTEFQPQPIWTIGYSFGSLIVWKTLDVVNPDRTLLIAPPNKHMNFQDRKLTDQVSLILGSQDEFADVLRAKDLAPGSIHLIDGADHFFSAHQQELSDAAKAFINI